LCYQRNQASLRYPPSARFGRLGFLDPIFANKKLKTHLREHSRQSLVPKIRSRFLSEFSVVVRTCFFLLFGAFFFFLQKESKKNAERKNILFFTQNIRLIEILISKLTDKSKFSVYKKS
jgi:hypothetical protein